MAEIAAITWREVELISRFVDLLNQEQEMLKRADASVLPEIGAAKAKLVDQLNGLENERRQALAIEGSQTPRSAMDQWLLAHPDDREAAANWKKLLDLSRKAKQLHELNTGLVSMHLQQTSEALAILTQQPPRQTALYGSDGQAAQASSSRIVDKA